MTGPGAFWYNGAAAQLLATAAFDAAQMAAMYNQWPVIVFASPSVVASGMTPPDFIPQ